MKLPIHTAILTAAITLVTAVNLPAQQSLRWAKSIGGGIQGPNNERDILTDFKTDRWGNAYIAGSFYNFVDIDTFRLEVPRDVYYERVATNGYVAKLNCSGEVEWVSHWKGAASCGVGLLIPDKDYVYAHGSLSPGQNYPAYIDDTMIISGGFTGGRYRVKYDIHTGEKVSITQYPADFMATLGYTVVGQGITSNAFVISTIDKHLNYYLTYSIDTAYTYRGNTIPAGFGVLKVDSNFNYVAHIQERRYIKRAPDNAALVLGHYVNIDEDGNVHLNNYVPDTVSILFDGAVTPNYGNFGAMNYFAKLNENLQLQWFFPMPTVTGAGSGRRPIFGNSSVYTFGGVSACTPSNVGLCSIIQGDTVFTQYGAALLYDFDAVTGIIKSRRKLDKNATAGGFSMGNYSLGGGGGITAGKDTLYFVGNITESWTWDNTTAVTAGSGGINVMRIDTSGNWVGLHRIANSTTNNFILTSSSSFYIGGEHRETYTFDDGTVLMPLHGIGSNRDIWIAQYGYGSECYRCDTVSIDFEVQQYVGNTAKITANTTRFAEDYLWDLGFGQNSAQKKPDAVIQYPDTGYYDVCLTASNFCSSSTLCKEVYIGCPKPVVEGFTYTADNLSVQIENVTILQYDSYTWQFGDGTVSSASLPQHTYTQSGTYNVCVVAVNSCGTTTYCQPVTVGCQPPQIADWNYMADGLNVQITNADAANYNSLRWSFGDGTVSSQPLAQHSYPQQGSYELCLTAYNGCDSARLCKTVSVNTTGIISLADGGYIKVYPNPAESVLNIAVSGLSGSYDLLLTDAMGRLMKTDKLHGSDRQLNLSGLSTGVYVLTVSNAKETHSVRIVKQ